MAIKTIQKHAIKLKKRRFSPATAGKLRREGANQKNFYFQFFSRDNSA